MSLFYDSINRKPKIWICSIFILLPILLIGFLLFSSKSMVEESNKKKKAETKTDIFAELDQSNKP